MIKNIPYGKQEIDQNDINAVIDVLKSDYLTTGPKVSEFEKVFAKYVDAKYAVAVSNGTAALHLSALALGVNKKSKIITTPITFAATANCIRYCGGEVFFSDINQENLLLDIDGVNNLLKNSKKGTFQGIIPVDFAGYPIDTELFRDLADKYGLWILEDACHAPGGSYIDKKNKLNYCGNGNYSDVTIFSFHPVKHIACGEGGMITTNNLEIYNKILRLRTHGIYKNKSNDDWLYDMSDLGYNYRLTDIQCALGISQLNKASYGLKKRREIASRYDNAFKNTGIKYTLQKEGFNHAYHLYVIQVENRENLYNQLKLNNIYAQVHYIPVYKLKYYKSMYHKNFQLPNAETYYSKCLSLPIYPGLKTDDQKRIIDIVLNHN